MEQKKQLNPLKVQDFVITLLENDKMTASIPLVISGKDNVNPDDYEETSPMMRAKRGST